MEQNWPQGFLPSVLKGAPQTGALSAYLLGLEAWRRGLRVSLRDAALRRMDISDGTRTLTFNHSCPLSITPRSVRSAVQDKAETKARLRRAGVPTPRGKVLGVEGLTPDQLLGDVEELGYPLVLKPVRGSKGEGVYSELESEAEVTAAFEDFLKRVPGNDLIVEQHFHGEDYRLLVLGDQVIAACRREAAHVVGNGRATVTQLIAEKNQKRRGNPFLRLGLIEVDCEVEHNLLNQGLGLESVPRNGQRVIMRTVANASAGGDVHDCTASISEEVRRAAVRAAQVFDGMQVAGVDILINRDASAGTPEFTVIELNYRPHIGVNMYPSVGRGQDVPQAFIDHFFPRSQRPKVPNSERSVFNFQAVARLLRSQVVESALLRAPAPEGYESALMVRVTSTAISPRLRRQLLQTAAHQRVCGSISPTNPAVS